MESLALRRKTSRYQTQNREVTVISLQWMRVEDRLHSVLLDWKGKREGTKEHEGRFRLSFNKSGGKENKQNPKNTETKHRTLLKGKKKVISPSRRRAGAKSKHIRGARNQAKNFSTVGSTPIAIVG